MAGFDAASWSPAMPSLRSLMACAVGSSSSFFATTKEIKQAKMTKNEMVETWDDSCDKVLSWNPEMIHAEGEDDGTRNPECQLWMEYPKRRPKHIELRNDGGHYKC
eukprot:scaffold1489_cov194-Cylindrotheca_fusiformis.AAC.22